ncbi:MAG: TonB-dependent receptor [Gammaproteobacteria bacterium]
MAQSRNGLTVAVALALACSPVVLITPATGWAQVEEIIVSTRKRDERLQDVPIAINAISAEEMERKSLTSVKDITKGLASVEFDEGASSSDTRITIRGLSPTRGRQNVAVLVDGIDVSTEAITNSGGGVLLNTRLLDIQRVEVVKGPQLALYGRSAFAGAIQYVTQDPSDVFETKFSMDANGDDQYNLGFGMSGPVLGDKLGLRFNAAWWDEPGFYDNALTGNSMADDEGFGMALSAKSQITDNFSLKFRAEYQDQQSGPAATSFLKFNNETIVPASTLVPFTDPATGQTYPALFRCFEKLSNVTYNSQLDARNARLYEPGYTPTGPDSTLPHVLYSSPHCETGVASVDGGIKNFNKNDVAIATNPYTNQDYEGLDRKFYRLSMVADWDVAHGTLTSRTGYIHEQADEQADNGKFGFAPDPASFSPLTGSNYRDGGVNAFILDSKKLTTQFSQEIMFRSKFDGPVQATVGGLYWREDVGNSSNNLTIQGSGSHCAWSSSTGITFDDLQFVAPGTGCYGYTERAVAPLIRGGFQFANGDMYNGLAQYKDTSPGDRNTEHRSVFGMLEYAVTDSVKATFEGRYSVETVSVVGPQFLDPTASGGPGSWNPCGFFFRPCTDEWMFEAPRAVGDQFYDPAHPFGGPFYSKEAFENWYDSYDPNALIDEDDPSQGRYRDIIPAACRNDASTKARLANVDAGNADQFDMFNPYCIAQISRNDQWFSPKLTLSWSVSDTINTYLSYAIAEKPGGFSTLGIGSSGLNRELLEFEPEKLNVYEIGAKTEWLDQSLIVNTAFFFQDYTDKQTLVSVLNAAGDRIVNKLENIDGAEVYGAEIDVSWAPATPFLGGNWRLNGSYTYLDAQYVDAPTENTSFTFISGAGNCTPKAVTALNGNKSLICIVSLTARSWRMRPRASLSAISAMKFRSHKP